MPTWLVILLIVLLTSAIALSVYWLVVLWHVWSTRTSLPTLKDALTLPESESLRQYTAPRVCVIVPAHNEQAIIARVLNSLVKQDYPNLSIVLVLDRCTDNTLSIAQSILTQYPRAQILEVHECPADWAGKAHALHIASNDAPSAKAADYLLFVDADTTLEPTCIRALMALAQSRSLGMLSAMSTLTTSRWFERVVQPAAGLELMREYPIARANLLGPRRRAFANGQCMLWTKAAYERIGGYQSVHDVVFEDVHLARLVARADIPAGLFIADNLLRCEMYTNYPAFVRGWKRIFGEAANRRVDRLHAFAWRFRITGTLLPLLAIAGANVSVAVGIHEPLALATLISSVLGLVIMLLTLAIMQRMSHAPALAGFFFPIGAWMVGTIMIQAASDLEQGVPTQWGGKIYAQKPRPKSES